MFIRGLYSSKFMAISQIQKIISIVLHPQIKCLLFLILLSFVSPYKLHAQVSCTGGATINAGVNVTVCIGDTVFLNGSYTGTGTTKWSGGAGVFIPNDAALTTSSNVMSYSDVVRDSDLPADSDIVADNRAAGNPGLNGHKKILSYFDIMSNMTEIIYCECPCAKSAGSSWLVLS